MISYILLFFYGDQRWDVGQVDDRIGSTLVPRSECPNAARLAARVTRIRPARARSATTGCNVFSFLGGESDVPSERNC